MMFDTGNRDIEFYSQPSMLIFVCKFSSLLFWEIKKYIWYVQISSTILVVFSIENWWISWYSSIIQCISEYVHTLQRRKWKSKRFPNFLLMESMYVRTYKEKEIILLVFCWKTLRTISYRIFCSINHPRKSQMVLSFWYKKYVYFYIQKIYFIRLNAHHWITELNEIHKI